MNIKELTLEEKIGQLFMVGLEQDVNQTIEMLVKNKIGGTILYRKNYNTYQDMINLVNKIKSNNKANKIPMFISIDQEGGRVNRMPKEVLNLKSATKFSQTKDMELVRQTGTVIGQMLIESGVSMDYAPVFDIKRFNEDHAIGDRCYGCNKEEVSNYAIEVMKQIKKQNVISVVKHFPGHGLTKKDSHFSIPKIEEKIEKIQNEDIIPFEKAIAEGADAIMVGHLIIKDIDKKYPASLSKEIIQKYLIEKNNFKGLIITDDFKMLAIRIHYNMKRAVKRAINAGNDIVMIGLPYKKVEHIIKYIINETKKGKISEQRINESVNKIIQIKQKYNVNNDLVKGLNIEDTNKIIKSMNERCN